LNTALKTAAYALLTCLIAGCSSSAGSSSDGSTANAASSPDVVIVPKDTAPASTLPVYPGAAESKLLGTMNVTRCRHKVAVTTYTVNAGLDAVVTWYAARIAHAVRVDAGGGPGSPMTNIEFFQPNGAAGAGITQATLAPPGQNQSAPSPIYIGLSTYTPPLSPDELKTMVDLLGSDPAVRKSALAKMKTQCPDDSSSGM
jgi:hypothetical protein